MNDVIVVMYSTRFCPYCIAAKSLLNKKSVSYQDIGVDGKPELRHQMVARSGRHTVPQIWIGALHVGGFDELNRLEQSGKLDKILKLA